MPVTIVLLPNEAFNLFSLLLYPIFVAGSDCGKGCSGLKNLAKKQGQKNHFLPAFCIKYFKFFSFQLLLPSLSVALSLSCSCGTFPCQVVLMTNKQTNKQIHKQTNLQDPGMLPLRHVHPGRVRLLSHLRQGLRRDLWWTFPGRYIYHHVVLDIL